MSAWYVFSAMGFYPVNPAEGIYVIGSPLFDEVSMDVGNGKTFTVVAENSSVKNQYIQSATLNGVPLTLSYITHQTVLDGGELRLLMTDQPNKQWATGTSEVPPSMTDK